MKGGLFEKAKIIQKKKEKNSKKPVLPEEARIPMGAKFIIDFSDDENEEEKDLFEIEEKEFRNYREKNKVKDEILGSEILIAVPITKK